jgi:hypothetical protein
MCKDKFTIADLEKFGSVGKQTIIHLKLLTYETYEDFISLVYEALNFIAEKIEESRQYFYDIAEDQITIDIIHMLICLGFDAEHDTAVGGHCDILIKGKSLYRHLWIGEAKIHKSYDWLWDGFLQLDKRYSVGRDNSCHGGMIIYSKNVRTDLVMNNWQEYMELQEGYVFEFCKCNTVFNAFNSSHVHHRSGQEFKVKHVPISIHFQPVK